MNSDLLLERTTSAISELVTAHWASVLDARDDDGQASFGLRVKLEDGDPARIKVSIRVSGPSMSDQIEVAVHENP
ncbi:MAG: hypothetical protein EBT15_12500 [Betaproteobacteria bacterium]|nr:hypothetical protein [Betaproteobacteria bacterium]